MSSHFNDAVNCFVAALELPVPLESGTYNKFCPACFYRNGHPLVWCSRCGQKMIVYTSQPVRPLWKHYILRANSESEMRLRLREAVFNFGINGERYGIKKIEYPFAWSELDPDCTTPSFVDALQKRLFGCVAVAGNEVIKEGV